MKWIRFRATKSHKKRIPRGWQKKNDSPWNSLEIAKLFFSLAIPASILLAGSFITRENSDHDRKLHVWDSFYQRIETAEAFISDQDRSILYTGHMFESDCRKIIYDPSLDMDSLRVEFNGVDKIFREKTRGDLYNYLGLVDSNEELILISCHQYLDKGGTIGGQLNITDRQSIAVMDSKRREALTVLLGDMNEETSFSLTKITK